MVGKSGAHENSDSRYASVCVVSFSTHMFDDINEDAEKRFRNAYAPSDPTSELSNLIKAYPTDVAIRDLLVLLAHILQHSPALSSTTRLDSSRLRF